MLLLAWDNSPQTKPNGFKKKIFSKPTSGIDSTCFTRCKPSITIITEHVCVIHWSVAEDLVCKSILSFVAQLVEVWQARILDHGGWTAHHDEYIIGRRREMVFYHVSINRPFAVLPPCHKNMDRKSSQSSLLLGSQMITKISNHLDIYIRRWIVPSEGLSSVYHRLSLSGWFLWTSSSSLRNNMSFSVCGSETCFRSQLTNIK